MKSHTMKTRIDAKELAMVDKAAKKMEITRSEWVRIAIREKLGIK